MNKKAIIAITITCLVLCFGVGFYIWQYNQAYHECYMEAGIFPTPNDFLKRLDTSAVFSSDSQEINPRIPGDYTICIKTRFFRHKSLLHIVDTIPPVAEPVDITIVYGEEVEATDFVSNIVDTTEVSVSFIQPPNLSKAGNQEIKLALTDLGGNKTDLSANLTISVVKSELSLEVGSDFPPVDDFLLCNAEATFVTDITNIDSNILGEYEINIKAGDMVNTCVLTVSDTIAPELETCDVSGFLGSECDINKFIVSAYDATALSFSFDIEPDMELEGDQMLEIIATDEGGNITKNEVMLTLIRDDEPPVINGLRNIRITSGSSIIFKDGVTVTDNNPDGIRLDVNTGRFKNNEPGEYEVIYTATDASGNKTVQAITVTVVGKVYTEEALWKIVDPIIAKIASPGMSQSEIVSGIFYYVRNHLRYYSGSSPKINWIQGAVDGFTDRVGDCYFYACMSKALMDRAGIQNMLIVRSDDAINRMGFTHYWNLVNPDGIGWLHYDCLPLRDGTKFILWNDEQIKQYENVWPGYHSYDASLYPTIN